MNPKITEADIIDVLLGGASAELAERVKAAISEDPKLAAIYDDWASFTPAVRKQTVEVRRMADAAGKRVHDRLPTEFRALYNPAEPWDESQQKIFRRFQRSRAAWGRIWIQAAAAAAAAAIVAFLSVYFMIWDSPRRFFPQQSRRADITEVGIERAVGAFSDKAVTDEAAVAAYAETKSLIILPDQSRITVQEGAEIHVKSTEVWQRSGIVRYHSAQGLSVHLPQGTAHSLEGRNIYKISIISGSAPTLEVIEGRVRLVKNDQSETNVGAGRTISLK